MNIGTRIAAAAAGAAGLAATGTAVEIARRRRQMNRRAGGDIDFGSLHSAGEPVTASDGVRLHVEVDEAPGSELTVVFIHGYALNLDCWHFQREWLRGAGNVRAVYYDQRSHGGSGRSTREHATIDQLGDDLARVLDQQPGKVVLVGHSMGGMTIAALAERQPERFGPDGTVVGCALISTTAGGFDPSRMLFPLVPKRLAGTLTKGTVRTLAHGHRAVDGVRRIGRAAAVVATDAFAFGGDVPSSYVEFVDDMLAATPFAVVAEFFPGFGELDKFEAVGVLASVPTTIISGNADRVTSVDHSRVLHERIPGSKLVEVDGAGHMVILERHDEVNSALEALLEAAASAQRIRKTP